MSLELIDSPIGRLLIGASATALQLVEFTDPDNEQARMEVARRRFAATTSAARRRFAPITPAARTAPNAAAVLLARARQQLDEYFAGQRKAFDLPLRYAGTP